MRRFKFVLAVGAFAGVFLHHSHHAVPSTPSKPADNTPLEQGVSQDPPAGLPEKASTPPVFTSTVNEFAQLAQSGLVDQIRAAKKDFKPIREVDVRRRQKSLDSAVAALDRYLKNSGANGTGWRTYLQLDALQAELKKGLNADPKTLQELAKRYVDGSTGLEKPQFTAVANTLRPYADLLAVYQNPQAQAQYEQDLDALATALEAAPQQPTNLNRRKLGELVGRIAGAGQAADVLVQVRKLLSQPNFQARVSNVIIKAGIERDVDDEPVETNGVVGIRDVILGTQIRGKGYTDAHVTTELVPSKDRAIIQIRLRGKTNSQTVGRNGPVTIYSHGTTSLDGRKRIELQAAMFTGLWAIANCYTRNHIDGLSISAGPIVRRIATRRVYGSQGTAQAIAGQHAEERLEGRMNRQADPMIANANRTYNNQFRFPLIRRGAFPQVFNFSTNLEWLSVVGLQARHNELGAPIGPPDADPNALVSVRLHESMVENFGDAVEAGRTMRNMAYRRAMRDLNSEPYTKAEFADLLLCLVETGAPDEEYNASGALEKRPRDNDLVIPERNFASLMRDRFRIDVPQDKFPKEFHALTHAIYDESIGPNRTHYRTTLTPQQYGKYLAGLPKDPVSYDDAIKILREGRVNYSAITYADSEPIEVRFRDGQCRVVLRIKSTTERYLQADPEMPGRPARRVVNPYPAEIFVTYRVRLDGTQAVADRVGEFGRDFGVKGIELPREEEEKLSTPQRRKRSTLLTQTMPRIFFGIGPAARDDAAAPADADEEAEPVFPASKTSEGLHLHGRWEDKLGVLPWNQLVSQDGWLALGWTVQQPSGGTE